MSEQDTIIRFREEGTKARIETSNAKLLKELENLAKSRKDVICEEQRKNRGVYILPKYLLVYIHRWYIARESSSRRTIQAKLWKQAAKKQKTAQPEQQGPSQA